MPAPDGGDAPKFHLRSAPRRRVVYFGVGEFAVAPLVALAESENEIAAVVTSPPRPRGRGMRESPSPVAAAAAELSLPIFAFEKAPECAPRLREIAPLFCVVCDYGRILPRGVLRLAPDFVNIHPSLLPRWRGAAPIERAILAGDENTGVSIMRMDSGLDSGPVALQESVAVAGRDRGELSAALSKIGARLILRALAEWRGIDPLPQIEAPTYAAKIAPEERVLRFEDAAESLARRVAAFAPAPGARAFLRGESLKILAAKAIPHPAPSAASAPGKIVSRDESRIVAQCGEGALAVSRLQRGGKKPQNVDDFLRGFALGPNPKFESAIDGR